MEEKYKLQQEYDNLCIEGQKVFQAYYNDNKVLEWVTKYMPYLDKSAREVIINYYNDKNKHTQCNIDDDTCQIGDKN